MFVIGTAGHVDHGKSTLIKNLTNIDPDRLIEEIKSSCPLLTHSLVCLHTSLKTYLLIILKMMTKIRRILS